MQKVWKEQEEQMPCLVERRRELAVEQETVPESEP